jgi:hypothetical protein
MGMHVFYENKMAALGQQFKHLLQNLFSDHEGAELDTVGSFRKKKEAFQSLCSNILFLTAVYRIWKLDLMDLDRCSEVSSTIKVKQCHNTPMEVQGEKRCSFYSFMTSALEGVSGQHHAPLFNC